MEVEAFKKWLKEADENQIKRIESLCKEEIAKRSIEQLSSGSSGWYGAGV